MTYFSQLQSRSFRHALAATRGAFVSGSICFLATGLSSEKPETFSPPHRSIIPAPSEIRFKDSPGFVLNAETKLITLSAPNEATVVLNFIRELVAPATGLRLLSASGALSTENAIIFDFSSAAPPSRAAEASAAEGYELMVDDHRVIIRATTAAGAFYAAQSLRQLLPVEVERGTWVKNVAWTIPAVEIRDQPRFKWRGLLFDSGRTFFSAAEVKRMIDLMALQKLNVLHWHLTDDQGWRIEIKKYPRLTEIGAWRAESPLRTDRTRGDSVRYGGFYTQDEIRDVVAYAATRFVTVMPEIELPGHAAAAIAAYPSLGNSDIPNFAPHVMTRWGVHPYTFAPREETFAFLEEVLSEAMDLFPSRYIHIGGDEAPTAQWHASAFAQNFMREHGLKDEHELQSHFIARIGKFLARNQRALVGWDEIQDGGTPAGAAVMLWRARPPKGADPKITSDWTNLWAPLRSGHDIILAPNTHLYLDQYQADPKTSAEPMAIGGLNPLAHVYSFEPPFAELSAIEATHILGLEGTLWSEYLWDFPKLQYTAFPRAAAVAEIGWSPREEKNFEQFELRLIELQHRWDELGVTYRKAGTIPLRTIQ